MNGGAVPAALLNVRVISYWVLLTHSDYIVSDDDGANISFSALPVTGDI